MPTLNESRPLVDERQRQLRDEAAAWRRARPGPRSAAAHRRREPIRRRLGWSLIGLGMQLAMPGRR